MQNIKIFAVVFLLLFLYSCSGSNKVIDSNSKNDTLVSGPLVPNWKKLERKLTREYIYKNETLDKTEYSILIFSRHPKDNQERNKYLLICKELVDRILTIKEIKSIDKNLNTIVFYIPVLKDVGDYCENVINNYDYSRAKIITESFDLKIKSTAFLFVKDKTYVKMDLSNTENYEDIELAVSKWKEFVLLAEITSNEIRITTFFESMFKVAMTLSKIVVSKS